MEPNTTAVPEQSVKEQLREIRELLNKATPGPWKVDVSDNFGNDWPITTGTFSEDGKCYHVCTDGLHASELTSGDAKADAELICALRNNAASLLDAYALGLRHMREQAAKALEDLSDIHLVRSDWDAAQYLACCEACEAIRNLPAGGSK